MKYTTMIYRFDLIHVLLDSVDSSPKHNVTHGFSPHAHFVAAGAASFPKLDQNGIFIFYDVDKFW